MNKSTEQFEKIVTNGLRSTRLAPVIECVDGTILSVQASGGHYCTPRDDFGPYTSVEVLLRSPGRLPRSWKAKAGQPAGFVPVSKVRRYIRRHGGEKAGQ